MHESPFYPHPGRRCCIYRRLMFLSLSLSYSDRAFFPTTGRDIYSGQLASLTRNSPHLFSVTPPIHRILEPMFSQRLARVPYASSFFQKKRRIEEKRKPCPVIIPCPVNASLKDEKDAGLKGHIQRPRRENVKEKAGWERRRHPSQRFYLTRDRQPPYFVPWL